MNNEYKNGICYESLEKTSENINILDSMPVVKRHPYVFLAVLCVLSGFGITQDVTPYMDWWFVLTLGALFLFIAGAYLKNSLQDFVLSPRGIVILSPFVLAVLVAGAVFRSGKSGIASGGFVCIAFILALMLILKLSKRLTVQNMLLVVFATGFLVRVIYAMYTPVALESVRQHDVFPFMTWEGDGLIKKLDNQRHSEYIEYIARYLKLPSADVQNGFSQLYHPPFHHIIAGLWLKLQMELGVNYEQAVESIQMLTVFYSSSCMITAYKIFFELGMRGERLLRSTALISLFPWFFLFSGSVNNDMLAVALCFGVVLMVIKWHKNPTVKNLLLLSLIFGLSVFTKVTSWLLFPAIVFVFVCKIVGVIKGKSIFATTKKGKKQVTVLYLLFGIFILLLISLPLGFGWQIKNYVEYGTPIFYTPSPSENSTQYVGGVSAFERIFSMNAESPFIVWNGSEAVENGIFSGLVKTSLFGETSFFEIPKGDNIYAGIVAVVGRGVCVALYAFGLAMLIYALICAIRFVKNKFYGMDKTILLVLFIVFLCFDGNYVYNCFAYPYICFMNFRNAVPCVILPVALIGFDKSEKNAYGIGDRVYHFVSGICVKGFIVLSVAVYMLLAINE